MIDTRSLPASARSTRITAPTSSQSEGNATTASGIKAQPLSATSISRRRTAANDSSVSNPCLSCGACCAHFRVSFYCGEIAGEGGGIVPAELVTQVSPLRGCMKGTEYGGQRCVALRGELGQEGIHCAIYEQRPSPCREFPAWLEDGSPNPDCQRLRKAIGLPPLPSHEGDDDLHPTTNPPRRGDVAA
ncbi:MAG TPA: YkgJ family cysteine cluster protein [Candidimonas sp.]|nr:YkgJ family cysteine cluster protein [Candidimonas sp.]